MFLPVLPAGQELAPQSRCTLAAGCSGCAKRAPLGAASRQGLRCAGAAGAAGAHGRPRGRAHSAPASSPPGYGAGERLQLLPSEENRPKEFPFPQEQLETQLQLLRGERTRLEALRGSESQKHQEYQRKAAAERQKIVAAFEQLHQFLEEQEELVLAELGELESGIGKSQGETVTRLSKEISRLDSLIGKLEGKCQQAASDLLQDIRSMLSRCKKKQFQLPEGICPQLETRLSILSRQTLALQETLKKFQETLPSALEEAKREPAGSYKRATLTLDPDTANPYLFLSADRRSLSCTFKQQPVPNTPERFDVLQCVLGHEGFTWGRHCWEVGVEVGLEVAVWLLGSYWAVGVARESVRRKGQISFSPEEEIWAVQCSGGEVWAHTAPAPTRLSLARAPRRVRVCLDCAGGQVSFLDADTEAPIFTFPPASFAGDRIRPWFSMWGDGIALSLCH